MNEILTPRELAEALRVSDATIRVMAKRGDIPEAFRVGKLWRFHASAIERMTAPTEPRQEPSPPVKASLPPAPRSRQPRSESAFARTFPEHAAYVRDTHR